MNLAVRAYGPQYGYPVRIVDCPVIADRPSVDCKFVTETADPARVVDCPAIAN
jgi:hypothetical protein